MNTDQNHDKISFIICTNQPDYLDECKRYIQELIIPHGYSIEVIPITGASSMTAGYNQGMYQTDAKYKVYLHQDVFILNRNFISETLEIFQHNDKIGMIGMVGTKRLPDNACMWTTPMRTGALRSCVLSTVDDYFNLPVSPSKGFAPVQAVDGLLIMTQYDIPWREDLDLGWDFYDVSQSLEFARQGYRIVVPYQATPWVLHDNGFLHLGGYHTARKKFLLEYFPEYEEEINSCDQAANQAAKHQEQLAKSDEIIQQVLHLLAQANATYDNTTRKNPAQANATPTNQVQEKQTDRAQISSVPANSLYTQATTLLRSHLHEFQECEDYCLLCLLANIHEAECAKNVSNPILSRIQTDLSWIHTFYQQIKFHIWQLQYPFPADIQYSAREYLQGQLSDIARQYLSNLIAPAL
ncbi:MAG: glycosyltransferase family protein [Lachnospiraceae bacterium]|nr:glycosyltransferase family protein [Lachnospiraceae bacterium]